MKTTPVIAITALALISATAQAGVVPAKLWKLADTDTYLADPSALPVSSPDVTFDSPTPFGYSLDGTVGDWLATGGALNIVESTAGTLASRMSDSIIGTLVEFTGCITINNGEKLTFEHDDGMYLKIGSTVLPFLASPTSPLVEEATYTGPSGTFPFQLIYTENHSGPAVLVGGSDAFIACPDGGSSFALMGLALASLGFVARRARR